MADAELVDYDADFLSIGLCILPFSISLTLTKCLVHCQRHNFTKQTIWESFGSNNIGQLCGEVDKLNKNTTKL